MIGLFMAALTVGRYQAALRDADATYALAMPFARDPSPAFQLEEARDAYHALAKQYGTPEVRRREARCLIAMGNYASALIESPIGSPERQVAQFRYRIAHLARRIIVSPSLFVEPVPGRSNDFFVVSGELSVPAEEATDHPRYANLRVTLVRILSSGRLRVLSHFQFARLTDQEEMPGRVVVYTSCTSAVGSPVISVHQEFEAASSAPTSDSMFLLRGDRLRKMVVFHAIYGTEIYPPSRKRALTIVNASTWKIQWSDVYVWTPRGFQLRTYDFPDWYSVAKQRRELETERADLHSNPVLNDWGRLYPEYVWLATVLDIHRHFGGALPVWREAERRCRRAVTAGTPPFVGDPKINLLEIRQRIRWISHHDYNHWLLYRPYDWNLQIPPWTLAQGHLSAQDE
jgi:hypothetical protein